MELRGKIIAIQDPPFSEDWSGMEEVEVVIELDDSRKFVFPDTGNNIRARYPIGKTLTVKFDIDAIDMGEIWTNRIIVHNICFFLSDAEEGQAGLQKHQALPVWNSFLPLIYRNQVYDRKFLITYEKEVGRLNHAGEPHLDNIKKKIIKERYDIDWKTPSERYPGVFRD